MKTREQIIDKINQIISIYNESLLISPYDSAQILMVIDALTWVLNDNDYGLMVLENNE